MKIAQMVCCLVALMGAVLNVSAQVAGVSGVVKQNTIETVTVNRIGGGTIIKVGLKQVLDVLPSNFSIANPARIVFDFPATANGLGFSSKNINDIGLRSVNAVEADGRTRLVLNLEKASRFETRAEGAEFFINLIDDSSKNTAGLATAPTQSFAAMAQSDVNSIRDIQFRRAKDGAGVVMVELSSPDAGIDVKQKGSAVLVAFKKSRLPDNLRRNLDVTDFSTPIMSVNAKATGDDVVLEIVPKGLWEHVAFQSDNQFIVEVRPVKEDPNKLFQGSKAGFQGELISLNFQNIPLRELLHVFADITSFNIVVSDTVAGNVSLRLNDVPWDQALEIVLQQKSLAMRKNGNVIWIAPADELAAKEKATLESKQQIADLEPLRTEKFVLNYHQAEELKSMIAGVAGADAEKSAQGSFLSSRGTAAVDKRTNTLFITDVPSAMDRVRDLIAALDRPARQVLIEARIVEAEDSFSSSIGTRLGTTDRRGGVIGHRVLGSGDIRYAIGNNFAHGADNTNQAAIGSDLHVLTDGTSVNLPASALGGSPPGTFSLSLFDRSKTMFLNLELSALEFDGRGKVISSPRVVTADKVKAVIKHGTEIPYLTASSSGATTVQYRQAVLMLEATPVITPDDKVRMVLTITKDSPNTKISTNYGIAIDKKEVTTEVMVENGGTLVIGGIFTQGISNSASRIPFLGDLPYVGFLFKQQTKEDKRSELLVFITPKIINNQLVLQ